MSTRILYIEDEKVIGTLVTESLQAQGFDVLHLVTGHDALAQYRAYKPHLCLLDVMLPGSDGYDIAEKIRSVDKHVPLIFLTAKVQTKDIVTGFKVGCNDFIRKPFSMEELLLRVNTWIKEKYSSLDEDEDETWQLDKFVYYTKKQLLQGDSQSYSLTHLEASLLRLLYTNRNNVVAREQILQKLWGNTSFYNSRSLDVYIARLRKYFSHTNNEIITLKGVGYRFICE